MRCLALITLSFFSCVMTTIAQTPRSYTFKHNPIDTTGALPEGRITCLVNNEPVGYVHHAKIPFFNAYALHTLYVYPSQRNKGYGTQLLNYACDHLKTVGAHAVYIQPGPFELGGGRAPLSVHQLIAFYKKNQFVPASKWLVPFVRLVYSCMNIQEDAVHLMVKNV